MTNDTDAEWGPWQNVTDNSRSWLKFDENDRRFYGEPTKDDLNEYEVDLIGSDGYKEIQT